MATREATIKSEVRHNILMPTDIDNFKNRYIEKDEKLNLSVVFPSYSIKTFDNLYYYLLERSKYIPFNPRWEMRPDYTSFDYYDTTVYWGLILYINNVACIEDFVNFTKILIPPKEIVFDLYRHKDVLPNQPISVFEDKEYTNHMIKFYKSYALSDYEYMLRTAHEALTESNKTPQYQTKQVVVKQVMESIPQSIVDDKYIDLKHIPASTNSIKLLIKGYSIPRIYGYDFILDYTPNNELKRIIWDPDRLIIDGQLVTSNMNEILRAGDKIEVSYVTTQNFKIEE